MIIESQTEAGRQRSKWPPQLVLIWVFCSPPPPCKQLVREFGSLFNHLAPHILFQVFASLGRRHHRLSVGRSSVKQVIFGRTTTNAKCSESLPISCNIVSRIEDNCHTQSTNTTIPKNYRQGVLRCNNWCEYIIKMRMKKLEWERENYKVEVLSDGQTKRSQITKMTSCRNHSSRKIINRNCRVWRVWISELITDRETDRCRQFNKYVK